MLQRSIWLILDNKINNYFIDLYNVLLFIAQNETLGQFFKYIVTFQIKLFAMFLLYLLSVVYSHEILHLLAIILAMK